MISKKYPIILSAIGLLFTAIVLAIPFLTKYLIDEAIALSTIDNKTYDKLIFYIVLISSLTLLAVIVRIFDNFLYSQTFLL